MVEGNQPPQDRAPGFPRVAPLRTPDQPGLTPDVIQKREEGIASGSGGRAEQARNQAAAAAQEQAQAAIRQAQEDSTNLGAARRAIDRARALRGKK